MTLSSAGLRLNELISIISKLPNINLSDKDIEKISYNDIFKLFNSNPVLVARHFQYGVDVFFKQIVIDRTLSKMN